MVSALVETICVKYILQRINLYVKNVQLKLFPRLSTMILNQSRKCEAVEGIANLTNGYDGNCINRQFAVRKYQVDPDANSTPNHIPTSQETFLNLKWFNKTRCN